MERKFVDSLSEPGVLLYHIDSETAPHRALLFQTRSRRWLPQRSVFERFRGERGLIPAIFIALTLAQCLCNAAIRLFIIGLSTQQGPGTRKLFVCTMESQVKRPKLRMLLLRFVSGNRDGAGKVTFRPRR